MVDVVKGTLVVDEHIFHVTDIALRDGKIVVIGELVAEASGVWDCHADGALFGEDGILVKSGPRTGPPQPQHYGPGWTLHQEMHFTSKTGRWLGADG